MSSGLKVSFKGKLNAPPTSGFEALSIGAGEKKRARGPGDAAAGGLGEAYEPTRSQFMWRSILSSVEVLNDALRRYIIEQADTDVFSVERGDIPILSPYWGAFEEARGRFLLAGAYDEDLEAGRIVAPEGFQGSGIRSIVEEILAVNMSEFNITFSARQPRAAASADEDDFPVRIRTYATDEEKAAFRQTVAAEGKFRAALKFMIARLQAQIANPPPSADVARQQVKLDFLLRALLRTGDPAALMSKSVARVRGSSVKSLELLREGAPLREIYLSATNPSLAVPVTAPIAFIGTLDRSRFVRKLLGTEETEAFWPNADMSLSISAVFHPDYDERYAELRREIIGVPPALHALLAHAIFANEIVHMSHAPLLFGEEAIVFPSNSRQFNPGFPIDVLSQVSLVPDRLLERTSLTLAVRVSPEIPFMVHNYQHRVPGANDSSSVLAASAVALDRKGTIEEWLAAARQRLQVNLVNPASARADADQLLARRTVIELVPSHGESRPERVTFGRAQAAN